MSRSVCLLVFAALLAVACATSSTGRSQLKLFPEAEMTTMGAAAFDKMKSEMKVSSNGTLETRARCVVDQLAPQVGGEYATMKWEVTVFDEASPNAFALPGGKIGVHSGLFQVAKNQDQLATVMGHEIAHVLEGHSNERVSTQYATQSGIALVGVISGGSSPVQQELLSLLGAGAIVLPFSRAQESEADQVGLMLMARAGFDPAESIPLWQNMSAAGGAAPPEFLSTHPSHGTRITNLQGWQAEANGYRQQANARGLRPTLLLAAKRGRASRQGRWGAHREAEAGEDGLGGFGWLDRGEDPHAAARRWALTERPSPDVTPERSLFFLCPADSVDTGRQSRGKARGQHSLPRVPPARDGRGHAGFPYPSGTTVLATDYIVR